MDIQIQSLGFDADKKLLNFINSKVSKLFKLYDGITSAEVTLRLQNSQSDENKLAEIKLEVPKLSLFAKKQSKTFEEAIDNVITALKRQLTKNKEKLRGV